MATNDLARVPLKIKFIDPPQSIKVGRELRFEVLRADGTGGRIPLDQLDFHFAPLIWGEVRPGPESSGVVRVVQVAKTADIYDKPKYELTATLKARGDAALETTNRFALALAHPVVEIRFFLRDEDSIDPFQPQEQRRPLAVPGDFEVSPPGTAEIFEQGKRIYARILARELRPRVTVRFPNGERASLELDLSMAGIDPGLEPAAPPPVEMPGATALLGASITPAPFPAVGAAPKHAGPVAAPAIDATASLRREMQSYRREIDALMSAGSLSAADRQKIQKKIEGFRSYARSAKGPGSETIMDYFQKTLGEVALGA